jgi:hypothetical protein
MQKLCGVETVKPLDVCMREFKSLQHKLCRMLRSLRGHAADNATMPKYILLDAMRVISLRAGAKSHPSTSKTQNMSGRSGMSQPDEKFSLEICISK